MARQRRRHSQHCPLRTRRCRQDDAGRPAARARPARSTASPASTTAPASATSTKRKSTTSTRSKRASSTSITPASASTSSTRPAIPTSSARRSARCARVETAVIVDQRPRRHRGEHPPRVAGGGQGRARPDHRHQQAGHRQHRLPGAGRRDPGSVRQRSACCSTCRSAMGDDFKGVVSTLNPPADAAGAVIDPEPRSTNRSSSRSSKSTKR